MGLLPEGIHLGILLSTVSVNLVRTAEERGWVRSFPSPVSCQRNRGHFSGGEAGRRRTQFRGPGVSVCGKKNHPVHTALNVSSNTALR